MKTARRPYWNEACDLCVNSQSSLRVEIHDEEKANTEDGWILGAVDFIVEEHIELGRLGTGQTSP